MLMCTGASFSFSINTYELTKTTHLDNRRFVKDILQIISVKVRVHAAGFVSLTL